MSHSGICHHGGHIILDQEAVVVCVIPEKEVGPVRPLLSLRLRHQIVDEPMRHFLHVVELRSELIVLDDLVHSGPVGGSLVSECDVLELQTLSLVASLQVLKSRVLEIEVSFDLSAVLREVGRSVSRKRRLKPLVQHIQGQGEPGKIFDFG